MSEISLNTSFEPIPVGFEIRVIDSKEDEFIGISNLANEFVSKVKISTNVDELDECTISFEYSASHDSYLGLKGVPPWILFQGLRLYNIKYGILYKFINDYTYTARYVNSDLATVNTQYIDAMKKFPEDVKNAIAAARRSGGTGSRSTTTPTVAIKNAINDKIKELLGKLRNIDDNIIVDKNFKDVKLKLKQAYIFKGYPITNSFSGGENGVIKFDVTLHDKLSITAQRKRSIANSAATGSAQSFAYANERELCALLQKVLENQNIYLDEFAALLFGYVKNSSTGKYKPGTYQIPSNLNSVFTLYDGASISRDEPSLELRKELESELDNASVDLYFDNLKGIKFDNFMLTLDQSDLKTTINTTGGNYFLNSVGDVVSRNIRTAIQNYGNSTTSAQQTNLKTLRQGFLISIRNFIKKSKTTSLGDFNNYLSLIRQYFGIDYSMDLNSGDTSNRVVFYVSGDRSGTQKTDTALADEVLDKVILLEYGGAVVNFSHTVKTAGVSMKDLSSGKTSVTLSLDNAYSINLNLDTSKIKEYAKEVYSIAAGDLNKYIDFIKKQIATDPDEFLLNFIYYSVDQAGATITPEQIGQGKKQGNQLLTMTLRNPIPLIGRGTPIYFTTIGEERQNSKSIGSEVGSDSLAQGSGFYVLPDKVRGFYVTTKVTHVFSPKENVWVQTVECER